MSADDLTWRPLVLADLPALLALVSACEETDDPPYRTDLAELREDLFTGAWCVPETDTLAGVEADGAIVAYGRFRVEGSRDGRTDANLGGGVHPTRRRRGLGTHILRWQLERARAEGGRVQLASYVEEGVADHAAILTAAGFAPVRYFAELRRDLSRPIPTVALTGSLVLEPWQAELDEQVRLAHNDAFADHWGSHQVSPEVWREGAAHFAPGWSFVVMDRSTDRVRVAGYLMSSRYEQDWSALGYTAGYTDLIGVLRQWRGRRVATALLLAAMRAYAADGMEYAGLSVDSAAPRTEHTLYRRLGYEPVRGSTRFQALV